MTQRQRIAVDADREAHDGRNQVFRHVLSLEHVHAFGCGFEAHCLGPLEPVRVGVGTDPPDWLEHLAVPQLGQQVEANIVKQCASMVD